MNTYKIDYTKQTSGTTAIPLENCQRYIEIRQDNVYSYDPCLNCPNDPRNGGSGICNCTLPDYYQKRWTGDKFDNYWDTKLESLKFYNTVTSTDLKFITPKKDKSVSILSKNGIKKIIKVPCHTIKEGNNNE